MIVLSKISTVILKSCNLLLLILAGLLFDHMYGKV